MARAVWLHKVQPTIHTIYQNIINYSITRKQLLHIVRWDQHTTSVSTLCFFEPSGARLVAAHRDGKLRFYDFHGMQPTPTTSETNTYLPFRIRFR